MQKTQFLVIGYGNTLRSDDGVGPRVVEAIERMNLPGVRTLLGQQLAPEYAEAISKAGLVIFVDAAVDGVKDVQLRKLEAGGATQRMTHAADPRTLLAIAREVFGHAPEAWRLTIPTLTMEFGEDLSPEAQRGSEQAIKVFYEFYRER